MFTTETIGSGNDALSEKRDSMVDVLKLIDRYEERREQRRQRLSSFLEEDRTGFLIVQHPCGNIWTACNSVEEVCRNNIEYFRDCLQVDWTDDLPFLSPWVGTGVYANAFGCEYVWRDDNAPHVHYLCHRIEEVRDIEYPETVT